MAGRVKKAPAVAKPKPAPAPVVAAPVVTSVTRLAARPSRRHARREYRHRAEQCGRLLFTGYLPPGTYIEIRCPACGRIHVITVLSAENNGAVDIVQQVD